MAERIIIRGDSYQQRRPLYIIEMDAVNPITGTIGPLNLAGTTVRTTFKRVPTDPVSDPNDTDAPIKADVTISSTGVATSNGLVLVGAANAGKLAHYLSAVQSRSLPLGQQWVSDVVVIFADTGEEISKEYTDTVSAISRITNREVT